MKVYLWEHQEGVFLVNEDYTMVSKPYFIKQPKRVAVLKDRVDSGDVSNLELLKSITDEDLQKLVDDAIINWKLITPYLIGFSEDFIAVAEI